MIVFNCKKKTQERANYNDLLGLDQEHEKFLKILIRLLTK